MSALPWKVFWAALGSASALTLGVLGVTVVPPLAAAVAAVAVGGATALVARRLVFTSPMFLSLTTRAREQMALWLAAAAVAHVAWVGAFLLRPGLWLVWLLALVVLAGSEVGLARAWEWQLARPVVSPGSVAGADRPVDPSVQEQPARVMTAALGKAALDRITVVRHEPIQGEGDNEPFGHRFLVREPSNQTTKAKKED